LLINGLILLAGEGLRRKAAARPVPVPVAARAGGDASTATATGPGGRSRQDTTEARRADTRITGLGNVNAGIIGVLQIGALCAGISRDGITMVGGLWRGLDREDAARFAFLLATPPILAAGVLKLPSLAGSAGEHIHGQVIVGAIVAGIAAYLSVRYLVRYFKTRSLMPFGIYCLAAGTLSLIHFA
ncbi:MAG: undecaprenyl-diphosphate phosphatase, partial [Acidimicrobiaceae bacterium]|nr:undecaprenyl-diphosphate phosphatase [Acidimicrobiaceae bacterium]